MDPGFPTELRHFKPIVEAYCQAKLRQFATGISARFNMGWTAAQVDSLVSEALPLAPPDTAPDAAGQNTTAGTLRLVLRHDCQSTGCGDTGCTLCQYNPSRLCKRNLKNKYLIDDHLRAKCNASLRIEVIDESGNSVTEGWPTGMQLEVHVLNGEKYKEICPDNTLISNANLLACVISHHQKALLKREGGSDDQLRCFLQLEQGQGPISDLQVTTSSEALLAGKAPTFRLLVWAVDAAGEPLSNITYVVSENFVVATKRVKHAIKSDIPSVADSVSKLVHIGKATLDKLMDLRGAAREEGFEISISDELNRIDKVGQFQLMVEVTEKDSDLKNKIRHLLKLSPEKWDEVSQHALAAVVPDFRNRVWWCPMVRSGLLFACKNGAVAMDHPIALVKMAASSTADEEVIPIHQLDPVLFHSIPKLKAQAVTNWFAPTHPGWQIYWKADPGDIDISVMGISSAMQLPPVAELALSRPPSQSPFSVSANPPIPSSHKGQTSASAFAVGPLMSNISDAFPHLHQGGQHVEGAAAGLEPGSSIYRAHLGLEAGDGAAGRAVAAPSITPGSSFDINFSEWQSGGLHSLVRLHPNLTPGDSFIAEMEAKRRAPEDGMHGSMGHNGADRSSSLGLRAESLNAGVLSTEGSLGSLMGGSSWRMPPPGFTDSPSQAHLQQQQLDVAAGQQGGEAEMAEGHPLKRPKVDI